MRSIESYSKQYRPAAAGVENKTQFDGAASHLQCVELFAGCGAMAKGLENAGFHHLAMAEFNASACATLRANYPPSSGSEPSHILEADVRTVDWTRYHGVDLVAGGPPCQPFSNGGRAAGPQDARDMWPEAIRAVREMQPRVVVVLGFETHSSFTTIALAERFQTAKHITQR
jgi:DNA (cytosine-5)-methyltransferase 1